MNKKLIASTKDHALTGKLSIVVMSCVTMNAHVVQSVENTVMKDHEMKTTQEMIEVMQAYVDGKQIGILYSDNWEDNSAPLWNWWHNDYQIKPKAKVKKWKWAYEYYGKLSVTEGYYMDELDFNNKHPGLNALQKIEKTMKEFDE